MTFAEKLKKERQENNLSQQSLATLIGVNRTTIQSWEKGNCKPSKQRYYIKMAEVFHCAPSYLCCNTEKPMIENEGLNQLLVEINSLFYDPTFSEKSKNLFMYYMWKIYTNP